MAQPNPELVEFNRKNKAFWDNQKVLMDRRMTDRAILETAVDAIASEAKRGVSIRIQMSFEKALEDAARAGHRFIQQQARSGGKAAKADSLQSVIVDIVRQTPNIQCSGLLAELERRVDEGIIIEFDFNEGKILFKPLLVQRNVSIGPRGRQDSEKIEKLYSASIPGLKHRLTRARKKIREANRSR